MTMGFGGGVGAVEAGSLSLLWKGERLVPVCCFWCFIFVLLEQEWHIGLGSTVNSGPVEVAARSTVMRRILKLHPDWMGKWRLISHVCEGHGQALHRWRCLLQVIFLHLKDLMDFKTLANFKQQRWGLHWVRCAEGKSVISVDWNPNWGGVMREL